MTKYIWTIFLLLIITPAVISEDKDKDDDDDEGNAGVWILYDIGGRVLFVFLILLGCGVTSLCAWCCCAIHTRCRRDRVGQLVNAKPGYAPAWSQTLMTDPMILDGRFTRSSVSSHYTILGMNNLQYTGQNDRYSPKSHMARWDSPLTSGKHVFEFVWPWNCRGGMATVGVGTREAPLVATGTSALVGSNRHSWGFNIVRRQVHSKGVLRGRCPSDGSFVPDSFLMYLNLDNGELGWGNNVTYWGTICFDVRATKINPLYLMVGSNYPGASIEVIYRGSACPGDTQAPPYTEKDQRLPSPPPAYETLDANTATNSSAPTTAQLYGQTVPHATQPPFSEPGATQPPVSEPGATQPPVSEPGATQPPVYKA